MKVEYNDIVSTQKQNTFVIILSFYLFSYLLFITISSFLVSRQVNKFRSTSIIHIFFIEVVKIVALSS